MNNKRISKVTAFIIAFLICTMSVLSVSANSKEETIYVKTDATGKIGVTVVSEHLKNDKKEKTIKDKSDLTDIKNTNGDETYKTEGDHLVWQANGKDIYYEGNIKNSTPISIDIAYYLNGKKINPQNAAGKEGKVNIRIQYTNKDKHVMTVSGKSETMYTPFVVTSILTLDSSTTTNLTIDNGKIMENGKTYLAVGLGVPGLYESLGLNLLKGYDEVNISYDTTGFSTDGMYSVATCKIIDKNDIDSLCGVDSLIKSVPKLKENMDKIQKGSKTLSEGALKVNNGVYSISTNLGIVSTKLSETKDGSKKLNDGLTLMESTVSSQVSAMQSQGAMAKTQQLKGLLQNNNDAIDSLKSANASIESIYNTYDMANKTIQEVGAIDQNLVTVKKTYEANNSLITLLNGNVAALNSCLNNNQAVYENTSALLDSVKKLKTGSDDLYAGLSSLNDGVQTLSQKSQELYLGSQDLYSGAKDLSGGVKEFNKQGISKLVSFVNNDIKPNQDKLSALQELSDQYQGFTKTGGSNTKIIFVSDSVEAKQNSSASNEGATSVKETFWQKVKNFF